MLFVSKADQSSGGIDQGCVFGTFLNLFVLVLEMSTGGGGMEHVDTQRRDEYFSSGIVDRGHFWMMQNGTEDGLSMTTDKIFHKV